MPKKDTPGVLLPPPLILIIFAIAGAIANKLEPMGISDSSWIMISGFMMIILGVVIIKTSIKYMNLAETNVNPYRPSSKIVTDGPFHYSRNPIYVGLSIGYLGFAPMFISYWILILFPAYFLTMTFGVIKREEKYLEKKFGQEYLDYKRKVGRWL
tara:strand:+ start:194 stop:658 length:465 start_codon:yes stop_codon:yes gene_type:complete